MQERQLSLTTRLMIELERLWEESPKNRDQLVFGFTDNVKKSFTSVRTKAGLPDIRFHDLRHFFASMLIDQGESAKYVCDQMGHSSIQVTFDTYSHLFPQAKPEAAITQARGA